MHAVLVALLSAALVLASAAALFAGAQGAQAAFQEKNADPQVANHKTGQPRGEVWAWGSNYNGQLGDGTTINRYTPVRVSGLSGFEGVAGGVYHSLAVNKDGTVWAWGDNDWGQLGDGTTIDRAAPVQVSGLSGFEGVAAGGFHNLTVKR